MKLDKKVKHKWLKALRSGKYEQGQGALCRKEEVWDSKRSRYKMNKKYCCLGVACAIGITQPAREDGTRSGGYVSNRFLTSETQKDLANMNDNGVSFKKIAQWISKNL